MAGTATETDPVCGMTVNTRTAEYRSFGGDQTYYSATGSPTGTNRFFPTLGNHDWGSNSVAPLTYRFCRGLTSTLARPKASVRASIVFPPS